MPKAYFQMKLTLYYILPKKRMRIETFRSTLQQIPIEKARRIRRIRDPQSQLQSLIGLKLVEYGLKQFGLRGFHLKKLCYQHNKPYIRNSSAFSITHSQQCIACAISPHSAIGVDVEKIRNLSSSVINKYHLQSDDISPITAWTQKEAVLKVDPSNNWSEVKNIVLNKGTANFKQSRYYINSFTLENNYAVSVASKQPNSKIKIKRVYF